MFTNFDDIASYLTDEGIKKTVVLCGAHDDAALGAVVDARRKGLIEGILLGQEKEVRALLSDLDEDPANYEIADIHTGAQATNLALDMIKHGWADIPMKGLMQSATFIWALIDKERGLCEPGRKVTHTTAFYYPPRDRFVFASDTSFVREPTLEDKVQIIENAVGLMRAFGFEDINVGVLSAIEDVKENIPSTVDAQKLSEMDWPEGIVVEGPFALDNALDPHSAEHKGIDRPVAGKADLLVVPDFLTGNVLYKSLHFFGHLPYAGTVCGTIPAILTSRSDEADAKYHSILAAILQSVHRERMASDAH